MQVSKRKGARVKRRVSAIAALVSAVSIVAFLPSAASATPSQGDGARIGTNCVSHDNVTELVTGGTGGENGIEVGMEGTYQTVLTNADGEQIGSVDADVTVVWQNPANDHFFYYITETIELQDGTIETAGLVDHSAVSEGATPYISAIGTEGAYEGKIGGRQFEIVTEPVNWTTHIILCGL
jgi:allene oxide cyclase-like protein